MNHKNYTEEEIALIRTCFGTKGAAWLSRELNRTEAAIRVKAHYLGLNLRYRKKLEPRLEVRETGRNIGTEKRVKVDNMRNQDPEGLKQAQQAEASNSADRVMLRINKTTWVQVPPYLATPEYAERVRKKWAERG